MSSMSVSAVGPDVFFDDEDWPYEDSKQRPDLTFLQEKIPISPQVRQRPWTVVRAPDDLQGVALKSIAGIGQL